MIHFIDNGEYSCEPLKISRQMGSEMSALCDRLQKAKSALERHDVLTAYDIACSSRRDLQNLKNTITHIHDDRMSSAVDNLVCKISNLLEEVFQCIEHMTCDHANVLLTICWTSLSRKHEQHPEEAMAA